METIEERAKEKDYFIDLILTHISQAEERRGLKYLSGRGVNGIILFPIGCRTEYTTYIQFLSHPDQKRVDVETGNPVFASASIQFIVRKDLFSAKSSNAIPPTAQPSRIERSRLRSIASAPER